jgi:hypothetical protein
MKQKQDGTQPLLISVKECQSSLGYDSCMKCIMILKCDIRAKYVESVYLEMNPTMDKGVGFEF